MDEKAKMIWLYFHGSSFDADSEIEKIKSESLSKNINWIGSIRALKVWKILKPIILLSLIGILKEAGGHEALVSFSSTI